MKLKRRHPKRGRIEIIPMIDAILMLLIFYMSFSTFAKSETEMDVKLPVHAAGAVTTDTTKKSVTTELTLDILPQGRIMVSGGEYNVKTLEEALLELSQSLEIAVNLRGDKKALYQDIINTLNACAKAKIFKVSFVPVAE